MTVHASPIRGFESHDEYGHLPEPDDATITLQATGRLVHITITPYTSGRPDDEMVLELPTSRFREMVAAAISTLDF